MWSKIFITLWSFKRYQLRMRVTGGAQMEEREWRSDFLQKHKTRSWREATVSKLFRANKFPMINGSLILSSELYGLCSMPSVTTDSEEMLRGKTFNHSNKQQRKHIVFFTCVLSASFSLAGFLHTFLISGHFSSPLWIEKDESNVSGNILFAFFPTLRYKDRYQPHICVCVEHRAGLRMWLSELGMKTENRGNGSMSGSLVSSWSICKAIF